MNTDASETLITCPLCGEHYSEAEGQSCHGGCPLQSQCNLLGCPRCGYEVPAPTRLTRWLKRWLPSTEGPAED